MSQGDNILSFYCIQQIIALPLKPLKIYNDLSNTALLKKELGNLAGVYGIIMNNSSNQYIVSSLNIYSRIMDHLKGRNSNIRLQRSLKKYGLKIFHVVVYYFHKDPTVLLTEIETKVISSFPFSSLYNFKKEANSMLGYKHTKQAIKKNEITIC
jgi:group I intron endonuclease